MESTKDRKLQQNQVRESRLLRFDQSSSSPVKTLLTVHSGQHQHRLSPVNFPAQKEPARTRLLVVSFLPEAHSPLKTVACDSEKAEESFAGNRVGQVETPSRILTPAKFNETVMRWNALNGGFGLAT
jgi:hypothetical protein